MYRFLSPSAGAAAQQPPVGLRESDRQYNSIHSDDFTIEKK